MMCGWLSRAQVLYSVSASFSASAPASAAASFWSCLTAMIEPVVFS